MPDKNKKNIEKGKLKKISGGKQKSAGVWVGADQTRGKKDIIVALDQH